jgi:NADH dehydrogenase
MTTSPARATEPSNPSTGRPRVVIVGTGFGGLFAAHALKKAPVDITLIGKTGHHLFQPLLYQVATGILSEGEIAPATREIVRRHENTRVVMGEVTDIDLANRRSRRRSWAASRCTSTTSWSSPPARGSRTSATTGSPSSPPA